MLGREPRIPHRALRWLILTLLLLNAAQIVLLQGAINSSAQRKADETWLFVAISGGALLITALVLLFALARSRK